MTQIGQNEDRLEVRVLLTREAREQFDDLPFVIRARVRNIFGRLRDWPNVSGVKALTGPWAGQSRMRTGAYRVQFRIHTIWGKDDTVIMIVIVKIGHRDGFYDG